MSQDVCCQWYKRNYGVDSLSKLSSEQYEDIIIRANRNIRIAKPLTVIGTVEVATGLVAIGGGLLYTIYEIINMNDEFYGLIAATVGVPLVGIGGITAGYAMFSRAIWWKRKSNLLKVNGIENSSLEISPYFGWLYRQNYFGAKVSIPIPW